MQVSCRCKYERIQCDLIRTIGTQYSVIISLFLVTSPVHCIEQGTLFLDSTVHNEELSIVGYNLYRHDRDRHGGDVAIYLRNHLNVSPVLSLCDVNSNIE